MHAVGIDVSKANGKIFTSPFEINYTVSNLNSLLQLIKSLDSEPCIWMKYAFNLKLSTVNSDRNKKIISFAFLIKPILAQMNLTPMSGKRINIKTRFYQT